MPTILVTGGAGFIGSHLCEKLLRQGARVICLDNFDSYYDPNIKIKNVEGVRKKFPDLFELVTGDIRNEAHLTGIFSRHRVDQVVHLAARAGVRPSIEQPLLYQDVNIRGTVTLLEACKKYQVTRFIFASSSSVYGEKQKVPFSENDLDIQPISPYGATKRAGELVCFSYHHLYGMDIACLRIFTAYGPRQRPEMAIHKFTRLIDQGEKIPCSETDPPEGIILTSMTSSKGFSEPSITSMDSRSITSGIANHFSQGADHSD